MVRCSWSSPLNKLWAAGAFACRRAADANAWLSVGDLWQCVGGGALVRTFHLPHYEGRLVDILEHGLRSTRDGERFVHDDDATNRERTHGIVVQQYVLVLLPIIAHLVHLDHDVSFVLVAECTREASYGSPSAP